MSNTALIADAVREIKSVENALALIDLRTVPKGSPRDAIKNARGDLLVARNRLASLT